MASEDRYIKASRYDLKGSPTIAAYFTVSWWRALACAIGMSLLAVNAGFNLIDVPQWNRHPWIGWLVGGVTLLFVCYFLCCAVIGWRNKQSG